MKRFVMTVALACALSGTALAGNIPTSGAPSPAPEVTEKTSTGNIPTGGSTSPADIPTCGWSVVMTILNLAL